MAVPTLSKPGVTIEAAANELQSFQLVFKAKNALTLNNIKYKSENLEDPEVYAKLLLSQVTFTEAPITCIDGRFFDKQDALKELGLCLQ